MQPSELQAYLEAHIPISKAMGVQVMPFTSKSLSLFVPLAPNINHKATVFGGSLNSAATLACWGMVYKKLYPHLDQFQNVCPEIVIMQSSISFLKPITGDFKVVCTQPSDEIWEKAMRMLLKKGRAKIELQASIQRDTDTLLLFQGRFGMLVNDRQVVLKS